MTGVSSMLGYIVQQMTGGTRAHAQLAMRLARLIEDGLDFREWVVLSDRGVDGPKTVRYPDVVVEPLAQEPDSLSTKEPVLIVEVLSETSVTRDMLEKPSEFLQMPSLYAYAVFSQFDPAAKLWLRQLNGAFPNDPMELMAPNDRFIVEPLDLDIGLDAIYAGIQLPKQEL